MTKVFQSHPKANNYRHWRSMNRGSTLLNSPKIAPFGSWKSPITSDLIVEGSVGLSQPHLTATTFTGWNCAPRKAAATSSSNERHRVLRMSPASFQRSHPRSRIWRRRLLVSNGCRFISQTFPISGFTSRLDQAQPAGADAPATCVTPTLYGPPGAAGSSASAKTIPGKAEAVNSIVSVTPEPNGDDCGTCPVEGNDFYSSPRV